MNIKKSSNSYKAIAPPTNLNQENARIWAGWNELGDKEVAREASAKGFYVDLAINFIAARRKLDFSEAHVWFKEEVFKWVSELLFRKQIFKASHVLSNINVDPFVELTKVFCETENPELREYVGAHLSKNGKLEDRINNYWVLLTIIEQNDEMFNKVIRKYGHLNVHIIEKMSMSEKSETAIFLFFMTYDFRLEPFLTPEQLWIFMLTHNKIRLMKLWITLQFSSSQLDYNDSGLSAQILEKLTRLLKIFAISSSMVNVVSSDSLEICSDMKHSVLNELSKYGVFTDDDKRNFTNLLSRFGDIQSLSNYKEIVSLKTSTLSLEEFYSLLVEFCLQNKLYNIISLFVSELDLLEKFLLKYNSNYLALLLDIRNTSKNLNDESVLQRNIVEVARFLNADLSLYFKENPTLLLSLALFNNKTCLLNLCSSGNSSLIANVPVSFDSLATNTGLFSLVLKKFNNTLPKSDFTFLNMLQKHTQLHVDHLLRLQCDSTVPHFGRKDLVEQFGYNKKLKFMFYLNQCRPSRAYKSFVADCLRKNGLITDSDKIVASAKTHKLALKNIANSSVTAACVAFLEMIACSSDKLRIYTEAAGVICSSQAFEDVHDLVDLFINIESNAPEIVSMLEFIVIQKINNDSFSNVLDALRSYDVIVKLCNLHCLSLPEGLLKYYAHNNQWLPFLVFVQVNNYPLHHVRVLVQNFKNPNLLEHINHSVLHDAQFDQHKETVMRKRDSRNSFLSRVGVRKNPDTVSLDSALSTSTIESDAGSFDLPEGEILDMKVTLLQLLIRCHNSVDPPRALLQACQLYRNPLLAVLATSYEPDSVITNWLTWLSVSCDLCHPLTNYESLSLCPNSVTELLNSVVKAGYIRTLQESFQIFLPKNPLKIFVEFLLECVDLNFDMDILNGKIVMFRDKLRRIRSNSVISQLDQEITYINNKVWIQNLILVLIAFTAEYNFSTLFDQIQFVNALCNLNISEMINDSLNFANLLEILKTLHKHNCDIKLDLSVIYDKIEYTKMIHSVIDKLVVKNEYKTALTVANIEHISVDSIILEEYTYMFNKNATEVIWDDCNEVFKHNGVLPEKVIRFFQECSTAVNNCTDKYEILKLAHEWAVQFDHPEKYYLEYQMWLMFLDIEDKHKINFTVTEPLAKLYTDMQNELDALQEYPEKLPEDGITKLDESISVLLNNNRFWEALRLERIFGHKNADLEILRLCCSIAEAILLPSELNAEQRMMLSSSRSSRGYSQRRKPFRSTRQSSTSSASQVASNVASTSLIEPVDNQAADNLLTIESLLNKLSNGVDIGQNILMTYRISVNIEIPYCILIENDDHMKMLKDALGDDCKNKIEVVHDCIHVYKWSKQMTADFICEELVNAVGSYIKSKLANLTMWDLNLDTEFHLILQFLPENCSLLGLKIYSYLNALHLAQTMSPTEVKISEIALIVELVVRAHDCFTADCNMEGIMMVLKKCQTLISLLLTLKCWKLIVRLLIGMGRYTEMSYVFQILRENDQFEFLLSKGSKKDNGLKLALLDYLKKYCPDNKELYRIVALHFILFSEVAQLWEKEAQNIVRNLIAISKLEMQNKEIDVDTQPFVLFTNTDGTNVCLKKAMENYTHATEYHLQGEKFAKAMNSAKQAELLAVQLSKVKEIPLNETTMCFLNLTSVQLASLVIANRSLSFPQLIILIEAYNYNVDWANVLYEQYIVGDRIDFFEHFMKYFPLTDTLVHDISRRLLKSNYTSTTVKNMKKVLSNLPSVHAKYRIASELGFSDVVEDLLAEGQLAYLKDTVWKKGYKS